MAPDFNLFFIMFTSSTGADALRAQRRAAPNTCVLCPVITLIIPTMGYFTRRGTEIRSNLTCREIQLEPKTNRWGGGCWGGGTVPCETQSAERKIPMIARCDGPRATVKADAYWAGKLRAAHFSEGLFVLMAGGLHPDM